MFLFSLDACCFFLFFLSSNSHGVIMLFPTVVIGQSSYFDQVSFVTFRSKLQLTPKRHYIFSNADEKQLLLRRLSTSQATLTA